MKTKFKTTCNEADLFQFLYESGLLYEINRAVLHPVGLALGVDVSCNDDTSSTVTGVRLYETDDPAGIVFSYDSAVEGHAKLLEFLKKKLPDEYRNRLEKYGGVQQLHPPIPWSFLQHSYSSWFSVDK